MNDQQYWLLKFAKWLVKRPIVGKFSPEFQSRLALLLRKTDSKISDAMNFICMLETEFEMVAYDVELANEAEMRALVRAIRPSDN